VPDARLRLLHLTLSFVSKARELAGVSRIALLGSLTTPKPAPKDTDLLVTITEEVELERLATLGRKLSGGAQSFNCGADVFLADPAGNYLGRTCHWKECRPFIRLSCDALHCGLRPYLHDDLEVIKLDSDLIMTPPLELWPQVTVRVKLPEDVEQELVRPLLSLSS
jgi:predicted nucleotidyltransferase